MTRHGILMTGIGVALANAMLRPVMSGTWHPNYMIMGVLVVAVWHLQATRDLNPLQAFDVRAIFALLVSLVVPSSQWAWISLGVFSLVHFRWGKWHRGAGIGLLVMAAAALREPVGHIVKEWLAEDLLQFDTGLVQALLILQGAEVDQSGNILRLAGDHALVVLTGCGSFTNISVALLVWYAACLVQIGTWRNRFIWSGTAVAGLTLFVNVLRLTLLAQSPEFFTYFHDGAGVWIIQTLGFVVIAVPILVQVKHEKRTTDLGNVGAGRPWTVA